MSTSLHTPGPFHVERPYGEPGIYIAAADTSLVAKVYENKADPTACCAKGNALLLAAAPDLLMALENAVVTNFGRKGMAAPESLPGWARTACTAIAKAKEGTK